MRMLEEGAGHVLAHRDRQSFDHGCNNFSQPGSTGARLQLLRDRLDFALFSRELMDSHSFFTQLKPYMAFLVSCLPTSTVVYALCVRHLYGGCGTSAFLFWQQRLLAYGEIRGRVDIYLLQHHSLSRDLGCSSAPAITS